MTGEEAARLDLRVAEAERALARDPANAPALLAAAEACLKAGQGARAAELARRVAAAAPAHARALRGASGILAAVGARAEAIGLAEAAVRLRPDEAEPRLHVGGLLLGARRFRDAAEQLSVHVARAGGTAQGWRLLSTALHQAGEGEKAVRAAARAAELAPERVEYRLNHASLLGARGRYGDARRVLDGVVGAVPEEARAWRARSGVREVLGELGGALEDAERAVALAPGDAALVAHRDHVAGLCGLAEEGAPAFAPRRRGPRARRPASVADEGPAARARVVHALMLREMRTRFGRARLGYLWAVLEPVTHLATLGVMFHAMNHAPPPVGDSLFLYYLTGLLPYLLFVHVANEVMGARAAAGAVLQVPLVRTTDAMAARGTLQLATELAVGLVAFGIAALVGVQGMPVDPLEVAAALVGLWLFAFGVGAGNLVISEFVASWDTVFGAVLRLLYFASGIYYAPFAMPPALREVLVWNPVLQGIEWFRAGFYAQYDPHWLDRGYLLGCALAALLLGLAAERVARRAMRAAA